MSPSTAEADLHYRSCTLCEAHCGLEIAHKDGEVVAIRGDELDEFSNGHICPKGNALQDLHTDSERIRYPLKRTEDGFERVDWDEALDDIADRLVAIQKDHGRDAVGFYIGNPTAHRTGALLTVFPLALSLGTKNRYSASSMDQLPHMVATRKLFGHQGMFAIPDIDRTDHFFCIGGNPLASNGSIMTAPGMRHRIRALQERGGRFVVVDPRRSESAQVADEHHFIRPGTDAWLLAAMTKTIIDEGLADLGTAAGYVDGLDRLDTLLADFSPEDAALVTGIEAEEIRRMARELAAAPSAAVYGRVGLCTQSFGALGAWLVLVLNIITGNLDRAGGVMFTTPAIDPLPPSAALGGRGSLGKNSSRVSGKPSFSGEFPIGVLAEEIDTPGEGQIRALITHAGNPVISAPNGARIERALPGLDFMVSFDIYVTETSRHADYILPPTSLLETVEYDLAGIVSVRDVAHYSPALFDKPEGTRYDWEVLSDLTARLLARGVRGARGRVLAPLYKRMVHALGVDGLIDLGLRTGPYGHRAGAGAILDRVFNSNPATRTPWKLVRRLDARRARLGFWTKFNAPRVETLPEGIPATGLTLDVLKRHPHGLDLGPLKPRLPERLFTEDKRIGLVHEIFSADLERLRGLLDEAADRNGALVLIGRRQLRSNNSWMHNSRRLVKGKPRCTVMINPADAEARSLEDGSIATVSSRTGEISLPIEISDSVMPGVVSIPHGWGHHREGTNWTTANANAGASLNDITDEQRLDELSGNAAFSGTPVEVRAEGVEAVEAEAAGVAG